MTWKTVGAILLSLCVACGGGSPAQQTADAALTAQELIENCVTADVLDLAALLDVLQNLLDPDADLPEPQLNLLQFLVDGTIGWSFDLDQDGAIDIAGTVGFKDPQGQASLPIDINDLLGGATPDFATILGNIDPGSTLELTFDLIGALAQSDTASGSLSFLFGEGVIDSVTGGGLFETGNCAFDFNFDDIDAFDAAVDGFPVASLGFGLRVDNQSLGGSINLDGTSIARVRANLDGGADQFFDIDLNTGTVTQG